MKKSQVIWSTEALVDLETTYYFFAEKSEQAAQRVTEAILARTEQIETFPESGATGNNEKHRKGISLPG